MKATKTTIPLRDRCLSHCATLGIPLEGASLDEVLSRAEKENLSHLHFLDLFRVHGRTLTRSLVRRVHAHAQTRQADHRSIRPDPA